MPHFRRHRPRRQRIFILRDNKNPQRNPPGKKLAHEMLPRLVPRQKDAQTAAHRIAVRHDQRFQFPEFLAPANLNRGQNLKHLFDMGQTAPSRQARLKFASHLK